MQAPSGAIHNLKVSPRVSRLLNQYLHELSDFRFQRNNPEGDTEFLAIMIHDPSLRKTVVDEADRACKRTNLIPRRGGTMFGIPAGCVLFKDLRPRLLMCLSLGESFISLGPNRGMALGPMGIYFKGRVG